MADVPRDEVRLHLRFGVMTELGLYQDTLVFSEDEWAKRDDKAIAQSKQALADAWVAFRSPQIAEEAALATKRGRDAKVAEYEARIADLQAAAAALIAIESSAGSIDG
jgi:hypothetical protein